MSNSVELVKEQTMGSVDITEMGLSGESMGCCIGDLRGVKWRMDLGILPSSPSASVNDFRRVTANYRRRYASLRRQLLVDAHVSRDGSSSPDSVIDNPLSQNPDSMWGRFFKGAELERVVDQDLSRLYPELANYFQTLECQGIMRRVLLLWCLNNPECGYRQGMHELLAPLLYVLHVDVEYLVEVRDLYEHCFTDKFDGFSFHENDLTYKFDFKKFSETMDGNEAENISSLSDLDPNKRVIVLINDAYGSEGELGILLSEKFIEHDAYCMFDALMNGGGGAVAMAEFFSAPPRSSSHSGFPPVIEASASLYHLLSIVDSSIHTHLVELGVEPQYFALRWLRVLFGREFVLEDLLSLWDEIFSCENRKLERSPSDDTVICCAVLDSSRGGFISAFAVSMILYLRSSLLATENATLCLQRLLNFPQDVNLGKLVKKAKSLQALAMEANATTPLLIHAGFYDGSKPLVVRRSLSLVPDRYWEERWGNLQKEKHEEGAVEQVPNRKTGWSETVRMRISRTKSEPSSSKVSEKKTNPKASVRRSLLRDLARQLEADEDLSDDNLDEIDEPDNEDNSEENASTSSTSSVNDSDSKVIDAGSHENNLEENPLPISDNPNDISSKTSSGLKERKFLSKFQWLWKFGKHPEEATSEKEGALDSAKPCNVVDDQSKVLPSSEKEVALDSSKPCNVVDDQSKVLPSSPSEGCNIVSGTSKVETVDQNSMNTLKNLGQSMLENVQVIESVFQQDKSGNGALENSSKNGLVGKGQVTAIAALKELRKISNLLSEM